MKLKPIGVDDFKHIVDNDYYFADKTLFIKEIIDDGSQVVLITRPRRFGKTLNMSMLKYYFEKNEEDNSYLFKDFAIWQQGEEYLKQFSKYPVITLTFKSVKYDNWEDNYEVIKSDITSEFIRHSYLLESDKINSTDKNRFKRIHDENGSNVNYGYSLA